MSSFVLSMSLPESQIGFPLALAPTAEAAPDTAFWEIENEVIGLFDEYRSRLLRYVLSIGLTAAHGEEIVQDVFLALFRHLRMGAERQFARVDFSGGAQSGAEDADERADAAGPSRVR